jgi:ubiquinone biosynthesis accessory factor UbiJ
MNAPSGLLSLIESLVNRVLRSDPDTLRRLGELDGKCICMRLEAPDQGEPMSFYVLPSATGIRLRLNSEATADVVITGNPPLFTKLIFGGAVPVATGELSIGGDIELGQRVKRILERIDLDWEERAANVIGDVVAHKFGNVARGLRGWIEDTGIILGADAREYLQEESRILAKRERVEAFLNAVDALRADTDRLEKRLQRLQGKP